ncbi:hypothetical protein PMAYCL1PPCAC_22379, partial [Pristionchus mayeri]
LSISTMYLDDNTAARLLLLTTRAMRIYISSVEVELSHPAAFITQLNSNVSLSLCLRDYSSDPSSFFGLPHSFWD